MDSRAVSLSACVFVCVSASVRGIFNTLIYHQMNQYLSVTSSYFYLFFPSVCLFVDLAGWLEDVCETDFLTQEWTDYCLLAG